jgi:hypothetical protein
MDTSGIERVAARLKAARVIVEGGTGITKVRAAELALVGPPEPTPLPMRLKLSLGRTTVGALTEALGRPSGSGSGPADPTPTPTPAPSLAAELALAARLALAKDTEPPVARSAAKPSPTPPPFPAPALGSAAPAGSGRDLLASISRRLDDLERKLGGRDRHAVELIERVDALAVAVEALPDELERQTETIEAVLSALRAQEKRIAEVGRRLGRLVPVKVEPATPIPAPSGTPSSADPAPAPAPQTTPPPRAPARRSPATLAVLALFIALAIAGALGGIRHVAADAPTFEPADVDSNE